MKNIIQDQSIMYFMDKQCYLSYQFLNDYCSIEICLNFSLNCHQNTKKFAKKCSLFAL